MGKTTTDWIINADPAQSSLAGLISDVEKYNSTVGKSAEASKQAFRESAKATDDFNKKLGDNILVYQKIANSTESFKKEVQRLTGVYGELRGQQSKYIAEGRYDELQKKIALIKERVKELGGAIKETGSDKHFKPQLSILEKLEKKANIYKNAIKGASNPDLIVKYNRKLEETETQLTKVQNAGKKGFDEVGNKLKDATTSGGFFKNMLSGIGGQLAGLASIGAIIGIGKQIFDVTAQFQKFEAVLTNTLGSNSAAQRAMLMIQDFAAKTPYSVAELTDSYVKFANRGLKLTNKEMTSLGDIAASTGKSFDQLTEAALDSFTGENERLKEFGIIAKKTGETTQFTFKGVTTEVKNSDSAVKDYLISLGNVEGVAGSMAAISETLTGKVSNLGDSFDKLFLTLGNQQTGVLGGTITLINDLVNSFTFLLATSEQLGKESSAESVTKYANTITEKFKSISTEAKAAGKDIKEALDLAAFGEKAPLETQLIEAEAALKAFQSRRGGIFNKVKEFADPFGLTYTANKSAEVGYAAQVERLKGQIQAIEDAKAEVQKPPKDTTDYAALAKAAKETAKKAAEAKKKALAEYNKQLEDLEKQAAKARLDLIEKNTRDYYDAVLVQELASIDKIRDELERASKAAGKGGVLGTEQLSQLGLLNDVALKNYYDGLAGIQEKFDDRMLELEKDSAEKQIAQIERRYDKEIKAANKAKDYVLAAQLEKAKGLEVAEATLQNALKKNASEEELSIAQIEGGKFVTDSLKPVAIEKAKQQAILDVQIDYAKKRLALLQAAGGEENQLAIQNLKNLIDKLNLDKEKGPIRGKFDILKMLGVAEEDRGKVEEAFGEIISAGKDFVNNYIQQQIEMADRAVEEKQRAVDDKRDEIDQEIELSKAGFASNVETKRQELEVLKAQRDEALKEQIKAQKLQNTQNAISQINSLVTAGAKIFEVTAALNIAPGVGLAIAGGLITGMFALMQSMKGKAAAVTKAERGMSSVGGKRHSQGGNKYISIDDHNDVLEIEKDERIVNRHSNRKYWDFLEAINADDEVRFAELAFDRLLKGTGVVPAKNLPKKVKQLAERSAEISRGNNAYDYKRLEEKLDKIAKNTGKEERIETEDKTITTKGNYTKIVHKKK